MAVLSDNSARARCKLCGGWRLTRRLLHSSIRSQDHLMHGTASANAPERGWAGGCCYDGLSLRGACCGALGGARGDLVSSCPPGDHACQGCRPGVLYGCLIACGRGFDASIDARIEATGAFGPGAMHGLEAGRLCPSLCRDTETGRSGVGAPGSWLGALAARAQVIWRAGAGC